MSRSPSRRRRVRVAAAIVTAVVVCGAAARAAETRAFDLVVDRGAVAGDVEEAGGMPVVRVKQGDAVELRWRAEGAVELHLHGYDIELRLRLGAAGVMAFAARIPGRFPVEVHGHGGGERTVLYLEVRP